jgi:hypothetical protein
MEAITKQSQDEAVKIALLLANQPAPPMPEFELDPKYEDAEGSFILSHKVKKFCIEIRFVTLPLL